ncbi:MAG: hypothetical protein AB7E05_13530 [Sphingobium sp.]
MVEIIAIAEGKPRVAFAGLRAAMRKTTMRKKDDDMVTILTGLLFSLALVLALGTIIGMTLAYHGKAIAALRMEHRPVSRSEKRVSICYSPARRPRTAQWAASVSQRRAHGSSRAA